jgi:murein DD-endopeptidase MepM/ murein hydrolase activator NlpD
MRSYTVTLRPDSVRGRYLSFVVTSRTLLRVLFVAVLIIGGVAFAFQQTVMTHYQQLLFQSNKIITLQKDNAQMATTLQDRGEQFSKIQVVLDQYITMTEKIYTAVGNEDVGGGGYPESNSQLETISNSLDLLDNRFDELGVYSDIFQYLPIHFPLKTDQFGITSVYGPRRSPFTNAVEMHRGIDLKADKGTVIYAAGSGKVELAGRWKQLGKPSYGRLGLFVTIKHGETQYTSLYGHCMELFVENGDMVVAGQPIGRVGNTGWSTGPHLHFAISMGGQFVNPAQYLLEFDAERAVDLLTDNR